MPNNITSPAPHGAYCKRLQCGDIWWKSKALIKPFLDSRSLKLRSFPDTDFISALRIKLVIRLDSFQSLKLSYALNILNPNVFATNLVYSKTLGLDLERKMFLFLTKRLTKVPNKKLSGPQFAPVDRPFCVGCFFASSGIFTLRNNTALDIKSIRGLHSTTIANSTCPVTQTRTLQITAFHS